MILGVFGGSGLYDIDGLADRRDVEVSTPYGPPSAPVMSGQLGGARVLFLPRHGAGHRYSPSEINYRANVWALKTLGATRVLSLSAVGSLRDDLGPGDFVLVDQFIDRTSGRASTFFGAGAVGHVAFADPTCPELGAAVTRAAAAASRGLRTEGTYVCMEGPQFSTRAESRLHRSWGAHVIGMTAVTEAKLCREAELCFAALALVTDLDAWHADETAVTAAAVVDVLRANVAGARQIVAGLPAQIPVTAACGCARAAVGAVLTSPDVMGAEARERLRKLLGREQP